MVVVMMVIVSYNDNNIDAIVCLFVCYNIK